MTPEDTATVDAYRSGWSEIMNLIQTGGSWSGHERNCCFLNTGQARFANVSGVSGLDFLDDSRCVAPVDWDHDGDLDLWLSARTGPTLRFVRNNGNDRHNFVAFRLEGTLCNRNAIGARVEVTIGTSEESGGEEKAGEEALIRTAHACDGYLSQASKRIHFGLGNRDSIRRVTVRWPGGETETFSGAGINGQFALRQGDGVARAWQPPKRMVQLEPSQLDTVKSDRAKRIVIRDRIPMAGLRYEDSSSGKAASVQTFGTGSHDGPILINLWATWCRPCLEELQEFSEKAAALKAAGIDVVALNIESAGEDAKEAVPKARQFLGEKVSFPFRAGFATPQLLEKIDVMQEVLISLRPARGQLPSSFLVDRFGRLRVIYPGKVTVEQLVEDAQLIAKPAASANAFLPMPGRWLNEPDESTHVLAKLSNEFHKRGLIDESLRFGGLAADIGSRHAISKNERLQLASLFFETGVEQLTQKQTREAARHLQQAVRMRPDWPEAHANFGTACRLLDRRTAAERHFAKAISLNPNLLPPHFGLGLILLESSRHEQAIEHFRAVVELQPRFSEGHHRLGIALLRFGKQPAGLAEIQQAIQLDPLNQEARENLAKALGGKTP